MSVSRLTATLSAAALSLVAAGTVLASPASASYPVEGGGSGTAAGASCSTAGTGDPNSCAEAVADARSHLGKNDLGTGTCDHVVAGFYGWGYSGSNDPKQHWAQMPAKYKHAGDRSDVPAGALAFFEGGSAGHGHIMISLGGGNFASTDVGSNGRYQEYGFNKTTIALIEDSFHETYLGWTQPWFNR